jgi:hypothetical protein
MKLFLHFLATAFLFSILLISQSCKSNKIACPTYSDNPAPTGIPKGGKTTSGVFPPDYKKKK